MLRVIEDLAGDWRRLDERIESLSARSRFLRAGMPAASGDERAGDRADHLYPLRALERDCDLSDRWPGWSLRPGREDSNSEWRNQNPANFLYFSTPVLKIRQDSTDCQSIS
jgi:hypothetical protein